MSLLSLAFSRMMPPKLKHRRKKRLISSELGTLPSSDISLRRYIPRENIIARKENIQPLAIIFLLGLFLLGEIVRKKTTKRKTFTSTLPLIEGSSESDDRISTTKECSSSYCHQNFIDDYSPSLYESEGGDEDHSFLVIENVRFLEVFSTG